MWYKDRVNDVITSSDDQIRGATLEVSTNGKLSRFQQPISLEVEPRITEASNLEGHIDKKGGEMTTQPDNPTSEARQNRPVRAAAVKARQQVHSWMSELTDIVRYNITYVAMY